MERHRFDPLSFIFGVLFVAVAVIAVIGPDVLSVRDLRWLAPALLVVAGGALLISSARGVGAEPADADVAGSDEPARASRGSGEPADTDVAGSDEATRASHAPGMGPGSADR